MTKARLPTIRTITASLQRTHPASYTHGPPHSEPLRAFLSHGVRTEHTNMTECDGVCGWQGTTGYRPPSPNTLLKEGQASLGLAL